jgi:hypothetical protein
MMNTKTRKRARRPIKRTPKAIGIDWLLTMLLIIATVIFVPLLFAMVR